MRHRADGPAIRPPSYPLEARASQPATHFGRAAALVAATAAVCGLLIVAGRALPAPPAEPGRWYGWWQESGPVVAVFAAVRLLVMGLLGLWSAALLAALALAFGRRARVPAWMSTGPASRPVLRLALLLSASSGPLVACGTAGVHAGVAPPPAPVLYNMSPSAAAGTPVGPPAVLPRAAAPVPRDRWSGRGAPASNPRRAAPERRRTPAAPSQATPAAQSHAPAAAPAGAPAGAPSDQTSDQTPVHPAAPVPGRLWVIQPGDDLWSLAARALGAEPGPEAGPEAATEIGPYWLRVIEANRARLPDPADPSLLFPGDTILLPAR